MARRNRHILQVPHDKFSTNDGFQTIINGELVSEADEDPVRNWIIDDVRGIVTCPFCGTAVDSIMHEWGSEEDDGGNTELIECPNCAYWYWYVNLFSNGPPFSVGWYAWISKLQEFEDMPRECSNELSQSLRRHKDGWHALAPEQLEHLVADIFRANFKQAEVFHVGGPADGGVDVLFVDADAKKRLIQVKRRKSVGAAEGVSTVRNLLGAMVLKEALRGVVVSTADHFTYRAYEAVGRAHECGFTVDLVDRGKLNRMLDPLIPKHPWEHVVRQEDPALYRYFRAHLRKQDGSGQHRPKRRKARNTQLSLFRDGI
jgi:hypothetical protein